MATTTSRTLELLSLLQNHRFWPGAALAERLEVSERTVRRDVDRLRELGYPVEARRGVDGGYQLAAGTAMPPLLLDGEEAVALVVGLHSASQGAVAGVAESSVRALAKLSQVLPAELRRQVDALSAVIPVPWDGPATATVAPDVLSVLAQACRDEVRLGFAYTARDGEQTERYVEPHQLVLLERRWYLVAYDVDRRDWRTFRVDRLTEPRPTRGRFEPRPLPAADAAAFVRAGIDSASAPLEVEAIVELPVDELPGYWLRWATAEPEPAGGGGASRVVLRVGSLDWALFLLAATEADFTVVRPPELRLELQRWARRLARAARRSDHTVQ
ncbi:MAG: helix-turn-helix transcriptional regulator [Acidimicrobiia bacterium]